MAWWCEERDCVPNAKQMGTWVRPRSEYIASIPTANHDSLVYRGLYVNLHILEFYSWSPSTSSTYPIVLVELIQNGLCNFNTSCPVSLAAILIFEALPKARRSGRRWGRVRLLLKILHKQGASGQLTPEQSKTEQHLLSLTKEQVMPEAYLQPIIADVKNIIPCRRH